ncbi:MAG: hypothetical protein U0936_21235 [Planctomycetaceae bacterium]
MQIVSCPVNSSPVRVALLDESLLFRRLAQVTLINNGFVDGGQFHWRFMPWTERNLKQDSF